MMKRFSLAAFFITMVGFVLAFAQNAKEAPQQKYIKDYAKIAVSEMYRSGVPASITLAQGILESNSGRSTLAVDGNNHFGIKCHDWKGAKMYFDDDEKGECFRKYKSPDQSFKDHSDFLRYRDRYKFLFDLEPDDYKGWSYGLKKAGYATDPAYATKLIRIVETYDLSRYDKGYSDVEVAHSAHSAHPDRRPASPTVLEQPQILKGDAVFKFSLSRQLYSQNGVAFIYSEEGDTYENIAKKYKLFTKELLRFNDEESVKTLYPGTKIYLESKKYKTEKNIEKHISNGEESLRDIAQRYGVRLKSLLKRNGLKKSALGKVPGDFTPRENYTIILR